MTDLADRLAAVRERIDSACRRAGRPAGAARVLAVSKLHPAASLREAAAAGQEDFGENYVQELEAKAAELAGEPIRWHFIGHLQRNKVKGVVGVAALIHAVDSERLLRRIARVAADRGVVQPILVAVNLGGEESKSGVGPGEVEALLDLAGELDGVRCDGLMTMPPWPERPEDSRPLFRELRELRDRLARPERPLAELSMGTTGDLEVAAEEGATWIRVGTAIFGPRPPSG